MKTSVKSALLGAYKHSGVVRIQEAYLQRSGLSQMAILLFHRVTDEIPHDGITIGTQRFRDICAMLKREFTVVPIGEIFRILRSNEPIPATTVAITFDDCYFDNLQAAHVLHEFNLPACFFIPPAFVGTNHVFDWDKYLPVHLANLTWENIREMSDLGFEIGSHTETHPNMATLTDSEARRELVNSRKWLEDKLGLPVRWFAFPFGSRDHYLPERLPLVRETGYEGCVSASPGFIYKGMDDAILPREAVPYFDSVLNLELHLKGCLNWLYLVKRRMGWMS